MRPTLAVSIVLAAGLCAPLATAPASAAPRPAAPATSEPTLVQTKHADVDGDGRRDTITVYDAGRQTDSSTMEWTIWLVRVTTATGRSSSVTFEIPTYQTTKPWYGWAKIDGRRGAELLFETHSDDGLGLEVLTWSKGKLVREGGPASTASTAEPSAWFAPSEGSLFGGYRLFTSHGKRLVNTWRATCPESETGSCVVRTVQSQWHSGSWHRVQRLATQKVSKKDIERRRPLGALTIHH